MTVGKWEAFRARVSVAFWHALDQGDLEAARTISALRTPVIAAALASIDQLGLGQKCVFLSQ